MLEFLEKPGVVIVILIAIVVFGSAKLPGAARSLGQSMRILKAEAKGLKEDEKPAATTTVEQRALPAATPPVVPAPEVPVEHTHPHQT